MGWYLLGLPKASSLELCYRINFMSSVGEVLSDSIRVAAHAAIPATRLRKLGSSALTNTVAGRLRSVSHDPSEKHSTLNT